jgi:hypothetical protein
MRAENQPIVCPVPDINEEGAPPRGQPERRYLPSSSIQRNFSILF